MYDLVGEWVWAIHFPWFGMIDGGLGVEGADGLNVLQGLGEILAGIAEITAEA